MPSALIGIQSRLLAAGAQPPPGIVSRAGFELLHFVDYPEKHANIDAVAGLRALIDAFGGDPALGHLIRDILQRVGDAEVRRPMNVIRLDCGKNSFPGAILPFGRACSRKPDVRS